LKCLRVIFIFAVFSSFYEVKAQNPDSIAFKQMSSFKFMYENDVFAGEDQYYSQGVLFEYKDAFFERSPFAKVLLRFDKQYWQHDHGILIRQDVYTPKSIRNKVIDLDDRPYAAVFYASQFVNAYNFSHKAKITSRLDLGVIGPLGVGEQEQKFIHKQINDVQPIGWEHQISNSFIANYSVLCEKGFISTPFLDLTSAGGGMLGVLNTNTELGAILRVGKMRSFYKSRERKRGFEFYATVQGSARYVFNNAIIQGTFYTRSEHTLGWSDLEPLVYRSHVGATLAFRKFSMSYYKYNITKEIKKGLPHSWGSIQIVGWF
jgi:lipid A 3-O-deacylase